MTPVASDPAIETTPTTRPIASAPSQRLTSVDALRGFDMFWIMGADGLAMALHRLSPNGPTNVLADQLEHADWAGFHFYDLIFPLFVFLAGVSIVFSLTKMIATVGRAEAVKRVIRRGILLFIVGIIYSGGLSTNWPDIRLMGVLNRIALAYTFAGLFFCFFKPKALVGICAGILIGYWAVMSFTPIRDIQLTRGNIRRLAREQGDAETAAYFSERSPNPSTVKNSPAWAATEKIFYATTNRVTGKFDKGYNLSDHIDFQYLPGKKYDTFFDPEGFLSTFPAIATCLLGTFAGLLLRSTTIDDKKKVICLVIAGVAAVSLGWLWNYQFPVIKKIWTSSFVLVAGGYSALLLATFYFIVDICKFTFWCQPFIWMGMNSITVYLASNLMNGGGWRKLASRFVGGDLHDYLESHVHRGMGDTVTAVMGLVLAFWFVGFLYRKKIFLRL